jgi:hypothetical protein
VKYTIIIFCLYLAAHIISAIAKESAKRKAEQRKREELARQRGETGVLASSPGASSQIPVDPMRSGRGNPAVMTPPMTSERTGTRRDDLAARRREQIEQLRNRRQVRQGIPQGGGSRGSVVQGRQPEVQFPHPESQDREAQRRRELEEGQKKRERQEKVQKGELEAKVRKEQTRREQVIRESRQAAAELRATPEQIVAEERPNDSIAAGRAHQIVVRDHFRARLMEPKSIRELLVLKEILDRPLSLRNAG